MNAEAGVDAHPLVSTWRLPTLHDRLISVSWLLARGSLPADWLRSVGAWKCACEAIGGQRSAASRNAAGGVAPCARMACAAREGMTQRSSALVWIWMPLCGRM